MKNSVIAAVALALLLAACAPIAPDKVAAKARPSGDTGEAEQFWRQQTRIDLEDALKTVDAACASAPDCISARHAAAWPAAVQYQRYCQPAPDLAVAQCMIEYAFWAEMGRMYSPSYAMRDAWASFNVTDNPIWREWYTKRLLECDPKMNKSQAIGDACVRDKAKLDFGIAEDATKGCTYSNPALASLCYWMAGFDIFAQKQINALKTGS